MAKQETALAAMDSFKIANRYEGMTDADKEALRDELDDLDQDTGIDCRKIKIPSADSTVYAVQGEDEGDETMMKAIAGVVVFTHRLSGWWPGAYGSEDRLPACSSMDGKTGVVRDTGEARSCETCPKNQFGSAVDQNGNPGRGKACKNMRRLYLMMDGDPNFYLLTVPPTSIKDVNNQLSKIAPYSSKVVTLTLEKTKNAGGTPYSKVVIKKAGVLPPEAAAVTKEIRRQIKEQYQTLAVTLDDYATPAISRTVDVYPSQAEAAAMDGGGFEEAPPHGDEDLPFA